MHLGKSWFRPLLASAAFLVAIMASTPARATLNFTVTDTHPGGNQNLDPLVAGRSDLAHQNIQRLAKITAAAFHQGDQQGDHDINLIFPAGNYYIDAPIRPLPFLKFKSASGLTDVTITNNSTSLNDAGTDFDAWNTAVIYGGHDQPSEGAQHNALNEGKITYRRVANWLHATDTRIRVWLTDYNQVKDGDEIKILSGSNTLETNPNGLTVLRPNYLVKAIVTKGSDASGYWLYLDIPGGLPFDFPYEASSTCDLQWGTYNPGGATKVDEGKPAWFRVTDWYFDAKPEFWSPQGADHYGFTQYADLGPTGAPDRYQYGFTSHHNTFSGIKFKSTNGKVMAYGMPCNSTFTNCVFSGSIGWYGNSGQFTTFQNCTVNYWDRAAEFSYFCYGCQILGDTVLQYTPALNINSKPLTDTIAVFALQERSSNFTIGGHSFVIHSNSRSGYADTAMLKITGDNNNIGADTTITIETPQDTQNLIYVTSQPGCYPPTYNTFTNINFVLPAGGTYENLSKITENSSHIDLSNISVNVPSTIGILLNDNSCSYLNFTGINLSAGGKVKVAQDYTGLHVYFTNCTFPGGYTCPPNTNYVNTINTP